MVSGIEHLHAINKRTKALCGTNVDFIRDVFGRIIMLLKEREKEPIQLSLEARRESGLRHRKVDGVTDGVTRKASAAASAASTKQSDDDKIKHE